MPRADTSDVNIIMPEPVRKRSAADVRADWLLRECISTMLSLMGAPPGPPGNDMRSNSVAM